MDFIGIDVGTSGCKASVISQTGQIRKSARQDYPVLGNAPGEAVLSLTAVWNSVKAALKELAPEASGAKAAAVSSLGETLALVGKDGKLLLDTAITYMDERNVKMWDRLKRLVPEKEVYEITGKTGPQIAAVNQYTWWKEQEPTLSEQADRILFVDSFIAYMLSGEAAVDYSAASNTLFFDINTLEWSGELADAFGVDLTKFPNVVRAGTRLGPIRRKLAEELGLPFGLEILSGCHDQISAAIGGGALESGDAVLGEGSTEALNLLVDKAQIGRLKKGRLPIEPFAGKGVYISMFSQYMHGNCLKWFVENFTGDLKETCDREGRSVYEALNTACTSVLPSDLIFLPYLSGTCFSDIGKPMGSFIGMDTGTTVSHLYRAMLEGLSCETAGMFDQIKQYQIPCKKITAVGGASCSSVYMQIKADVCGREIETLKQSEAGVRGLAMLCAVEAGCYSDLREAGAQFLERDRLYVPQREASGIRRRYEAVRDAVKQFYAQSE
ncbi:MAG: hypothetical protein HFI67_09520 [Lachnospiraceae bacterium]|jgi:xylulokinase|nr:hypothetical protein [Lachnospiraceae bacterium]